MPVTLARGRRERLSSAQYAALAKIRPGSRIVGTDDGDPVLETPSGYRVALGRDGRWRIVSWPETRNGMGDHVA